VQPERNSIKVLDLQNIQERAHLNTNPRIQGAFKTVEHGEDGPKCTDYYSNPILNPRDLQSSSTMEIQKRSGST
jgi:hypothetical protein